MSKEGDIVKGRPDDEASPSVAPDTVVGCLIPSHLVDAFDSFVLSATAALDGMAPRDTWLAEEQEIVEWMESGDWKPDQNATAHTKVICSCCGRQLVKGVTKRGVDDYVTTYDDARADIGAGKAICGICAAELDENGMFPEERSTLRQE